LILSQDQTLMLNLLASVTLGQSLRATETQLINARPIYWLLRCSIRLSSEVVVASRHRTD